VTNDPLSAAAIIAILRWDNDFWRRLAELNEYELRDFGASSADRFQELAKPFWRG
jgi:uncharacterized protein YjiS (DUF1127 family)